MENLRDYTVKHFTDEEQYMESINYKKLFTQKVQHLKFIHKLDEFIEHHNDEIEDQDEQRPVRIPGFGTGGLISRGWRRGKSRRQPRRLRTPHRSAIAEENAQREGSL